MPPKKKKAKKGKTTMSQNVKQSVVVHVNTSKRRQPTRSGNRSQPMARIQTPQFVGVVGQDYSTYNNQLNNITQAIANAIKQPDRTGNLITTPPRQAPDEPIHTAPSVEHVREVRMQKEEQKMMANEDINVPILRKPSPPTSPLSSNTPSEPPPPLSTKDMARDFTQRALYDAAGGGGVPVAESRLVSGRRAQSQPALARYTKASTSEIDPQTTIGFKPINEAQEGRVGARSRSIKRSLLPKGQPAEEPAAKTPQKRGPKPLTDAQKEAKALAAKNKAEVTKVMNSLIKKVEKRNKI